MGDGAVVDRAGVGEDGESKMGGFEVVFRNNRIFVNRLV